MAYETEKLLRCKDHPERDEFSKITTVETRVDHMGRAFKTNGKRKSVRSTRSIIYVCLECDDIVYREPECEKVDYKWVRIKE